MKAELETQTDGDEDLVAPAGGTGPQSSSGIDAGSSVDLETRRNRLNKLASRARVSEDGADELPKGQQKRQASASYSVSSK